MRPNSLNSALASSIKAPAERGCYFCSWSEAVVDFLTRGASQAVDIIYEAIGPVGPPVRPGSGSLFIVDERRLLNWRDDGCGLPCSHVSAHRSCPGCHSVLVPPPARRLPLT